MTTLDVSEIGYAGLLKQVEAVPRDGTILFLDCFRDRDGSYLDVPAVLGSICRTAPVPVYTHADLYEGHGIIGGSLSSGRLQGQAAADMALAILQGPAVTALPVQKRGPSRLIVDYRALQRFGLPENRLPSGVTLTRRPMSFYTQYTGLVWSTLAVAMLLIAGVAALTLNVVRRRRAEKALRRREKLYPSLTDDLPVGVYRLALDDAGTFIMVNPAMAGMFGYESVEAMRGVRAEDLYVDPSERSVLLERLLENGHIAREEVRMRRADEATLWVAATATVIRDRHGNATEATGVLADVTERRVFESSLRHTQKLEAIGTLAGGVAHEINNPINGVMNYAQLLLDRLADDSDLRGIAREIIVETGRVADIVRNLLAFSRRDASGGVADVAPADIVEGVLSLTCTVIRHDQIDLRVDVPADLPRVHADAQQIQQVIMNLVTNARDALNLRYEAGDDDKVARIAARIREADGQVWIRFTVEDHGVGMDGDIIDRVFEPFFTTKGRTEGTGLGLSVSHSIAREHGGALTAEERPGGGSRFHLDLPAVQPGVASR